MLLCYIGPISRFETSPTRRISQASQPCDRSVIQCLAQLFLREAPMVLELDSVGFAAVLSFVNYILQPCETLTETACACC